MRKTLNKLKIFANFVTGRHLFDIFPSQVALEVTNHCNLACTICPHGRMTRAKGLMSLASFKAYVDKVASHAEFVYLYGIGESLIHPELPEMINYARRAGIYTYLSTNVMLMDEQWSRRLLESGLQSITFAFDGYTKEQYERIRVKGCFETVIENIKTFLRLKRQLGSRMHTVIQIILTGPDDGSSGGFSNLFSPQELAGVNQIRIKPFYDSFPDRGGGDARGQARHSRRCFFPWNFMFVYQDGRVGLCCVDYDGEIILGDLNSQGSREIWNSPQVLGIRRACHGRQWEALPLCRACNVPEVSGFSSTMLLISSLVPTGPARKLLPLYEKLFLSKKTRTGK